MYARLLIPTRADLPDVSDAGHPERQRREDEGDDEKKEEPEEELADGLRELVHDPREPRRVFAADVREPSCQDARDEPEEDPGMERHRSSFGFGHSRILARATSSP